MNRRMAYSLWEQVSALQRQVFNDEIQVLIRILDTRDWDIPNLVDEGREDDLTDIGPELRDI